MLLHSLQQIEFASRSRLKNINKNNNNTHTLNWKWSGYRLSKSQHTHTHKTNTTQSALWTIQWSERDWRQIGWKYQLNWTRVCSGRTLNFGYAHCTHIHYTQLNLNHSKSGCVCISMLLLLYLPSACLFALSLAVCYFAEIAACYLAACYRYAGWYGGR